MIAVTPNLDDILINEWDVPAFEAFFMKNVLFVIIQ